MEVKFFKCSHCGEMVVSVVAKGGVPSCCGDMMGLLLANTTDAATEKHVPVIEREGDGNHVKVSVGSVPHPMADDHLIQFVVLVHGPRVYYHYLSPGEEPVVRFSLKDNTIPIAAYEYCNLHGLWKAEV